MLDTKSGVGSRGSEVLKTAQPCGGCIRIEARLYGIVLLVLKGEWAIQAGHFNMGVLLHEEWTGVVTEIYSPISLRHQQA